MSYTIEMIRKDQQNTSVWSGGTTTQLAIYPKNAVYSERNFKWRISSAKVEVEESLFTPLPGIWRLIMVLDGELRLEHEGHHHATLEAFQQDSFSGGWRTKSFGKVTDFNLMMVEGCKGELEAIELMEKKECGLTSAWMTEAFYCVEGEVNIIVGEKESMVLYEGDFMVVNQEEPGELPQIQLLNNQEMSARIVRTSINY